MARAKAKAKAKAKKAKDVLFPNNKLAPTPADHPQNKKAPFASKAKYRRNKR